MIASTRCGPPPEATGTSLLPVGSSAWRFCYDREAFFEENRRQAEAIVDAEYAERQDRRAAADAERHVRNERELAEHMAAYEQRLRQEQQHRAIGMREPSVKAWAKPSV